MQKWSSIVQYSCTSIWDLKYTFSSQSIETERAKRATVWGEKARLWALFVPGPGDRIGEKYAYGFLLLLKAYSWETDLLLTLGDFTVKTQNWEVKSVFNCKWIRW